MSWFSEIQKDIERGVKAAIRGNPLLGKLVKHARTLLDIYEALHPGLNLTVKVQEFVLKAEQMADIAGPERRAWVLTQLRKIKALKAVPDSTLNMILETVVGILPRKLTPQ